MKVIVSWKVWLLPWFMCIVVFSNTTNAGNADGVVVTYWAHYFNNTFAFQVSNKTNKPGCDIGNRYAIDVSTDKGKVVAAAVMAAKSSAAQVHVEGLNTCNVWGDSEDVMFIQVK
jgi:hypothetical protein